MANSIREPELRLEAVEQPRAHEYVAEQLRREIALRVLDPAAALPSERDLASIFRVSRATVRLAITLLEAEGLVGRRRGRRGGTFVLGQAGDDAPSGIVLDAIVRKADLIRETLDFRQELEPAAAAFAAGAAGAEDVAAIERAAALCAETTDDGSFMRHDTELHLAVGRATHNRYFVEAVERTRVMLNDVLPALPESPLWHERSHRQHAAISAALASRDERAARRAMRDHVSDTAASVLALLTALERSHRPA